MKKRFRSVLVGLLIALAGLSGFRCAGLQQTLSQLKPVAPTIRLHQVRLTALSFTGATLQFQFRIHNPNPIALSLNGFTYSLQLGNETPLVSGNITQRTTLPAQGDSTFALPVSFTFKELYRLVHNYQTQDTIPYVVKATFRVDLPLVGTVDVPVQKSGALPAIKPPQFSLRAVRLEEINWQRARLTISVAVKNPNTFAIGIPQLDYTVNLDQQSVANGAITTPVQANNHQTALVNIPVELNFLQLGQSLFRMLTGDQSLPVDVSGKAVITTSLPLLKHETIPIHLKSRISLQK